VQEQVPAEHREEGAGEGKSTEAVTPPMHTGPGPSAAVLPSTSLPAPLLPTLSRDVNPILGVGVLSLDGSPDMPVRPAQAPSAAGGDV
jgi:hypothetical protein